MFLPYSKNCHIKNFGTKDLRHANLPNRDQVMGLTPPTSPRRDAGGLDSPPSSPLRPTRTSIESMITGGAFTMPPPKPPMVTKLAVVAGEELRTSGGGVGMKDLPGRSPLSPTKRGGVEESESTDEPQTGRSTVEATLGRKELMMPLVATSTGTRYGRGLTGAGGGTNRQWGGGTPVCPKCGKAVYFAEQVSGRRRWVRH